MMGKILVVVTVACAVLGGAGMYYLQVYGYYQTLEPQIGYQVATPSGGTTRLDIAEFRGIDSDSSPLRYRACFAVLGDPPDLMDYPTGDPLNAPGWFDCFDAAAIGGDLAATHARAVLVEANTPWGFDRVMALYPDGRAFVWPQVNTCGEAHFDGRPVPAGCPPLPER